MHSNALYVTALYTLYCLADDDQFDSNASTSW